MRVLLDTHALIWAVNSNPRLSRNAVSVIGDPSRAKLISAVSAYEISIKHNLEKLAEAAALADNFLAEINMLDASLLAITVEHAFAAGKLELTHRDPFDRLLIAQALIEDVPIVSNEAIFDAYGVERIW